MIARIHELVAAELDGVMYARCNSCAEVAVPSLDSLVAYLAHGWPEMCGACGGGVVWCVRERIAQCLPIVGR